MSQGHIPRPGGVKETPKILVPRKSAEGEKAPSETSQSSAADRGQVAHHQSRLEEILGGELPRPTELPRLPDRPPKLQIQKSKAAVKEEQQEQPLGGKQKLDKRTASGSGKAAMTSATRNLVSPRAEAKSLQLRKQKGRGLQMDPQTISAVQARVGLDLTLLSKEKMNFAKILKPAPDRITCLVKVGIKTYVVKAGLGNSDMEDNVIDTGLLYRLEIRGVRAPIASQLTDGFRAALARQLNDANTPEGNQLLQFLNEKGTLNWNKPAVNQWLREKLDPNKNGDKPLLEVLNGQGSPDSPVFKNWLADQQLDLEPTDPLLSGHAQISTQAQGVTVESILASGDDAGMRDLLQTVQGKAAEQAVQDLTDKLRDALAAKGIEGNRARDFVPGLRDPATRSVAIQQLKDVLNNPNNVRTLSLVEALSKDGDAAIQNITSGLEQRAIAQQQLVSTVKSEEGAYALGGLATVDLLCGMNDRILGKWNATNFMFDPVTRNLWCVDNAKDSQNLGLSSSINDVKWRNEFFDKQMLGDDPDLGKSIDEQIHFALYDRHSDSPTEFLTSAPLQSAAERNTTAAGVKNAVVETVKKMQGLLDHPETQLAPEVHQRLQSRLNVVKARMQFTDLLKFTPDFNQVPAATDAGNLEKVSRKLTRKVVVPVTSIFKDEAEKFDASIRQAVVDRAETIKEDIRTHNYTSNELLGKEGELTQLNSKLTVDGGETDRRIDKALFVAKFKRLLIDLDDKAKGLTALSASPEKAWGNVSPEAIQDIRNGAKPWLDTLVELGDKQGVLQLNAALDLLAKKAVDLNQV